MTHNITLIPGDGVGPEITEAVRKVLEATGVQFDWDPGIAGSQAIEKYGTPLPNEVLESIKKNKIALKGPITTPVGYGFRSVEHIVENCIRVAAEGTLEARQRLLKEIDSAGIMATPANSSYNELVVEAGRASILSGGRLVEIQYP